MRYRPHTELAVIACPWPIWNESELPSSAKIEELKEQLLELNTQAQTIQARADNEKRPLTEDEGKELDEISDEFKRIENEIARRQEILSQAGKLSQSLGRQTEPEGPDDDDPPPAQSQIQARGQHPAPAPKVRMQSRRIEPVYTEKGKWGWKDQGEFFRAVAHACRQGVVDIDPRLSIRNAPTTYGTEGTGADGGWAMPPDFRQGIMQLVLGEESLLARTDQFTTSSNSITFPVDETNPWQASGGILAYWENEAAQMTQSKPSLQERQIKLNKLTALVPISEELLEDAPAIDSYIRNKAPQKIDFKTTLAIVQGTGAGQPLGVLNSSALVTVAKESGQAADTVVAENVIKMYSRMYGPSRSRAVWLINQDIEPQLFTMSLAVGTGGIPVYMPAGGLSSSPFGTLFGRPVIPTQACETLGDLGDMFFVDLSQYMTAIKGGAIRTDVSMHLFFDYALMAFRFILRVAGMPWWSSTTSARDGTTTYSPFVTLAERA